VSQTCIQAYHEMEERYARLVLKYHSNSQRNEILDAIEQSIAEHNMTPSITLSPAGESGECAVEFHDDYDKQSSTIFEFLIKKLGIASCEN